MAQMPASLLQWPHWNRVLKMTCSFKNTAWGIIAIEGQHLGQTIEQDAEEFISNMNTAVTGTWVGGEQSSFTYCQSFCTAPLGSSAQSGRPLSSWLQIHFGFCLQSSPPSRWCSRCSLVDRFAGAPLKWEKAQLSGQLWKGKDFTPDDLSIKTFRLPDNLACITHYVSAC